MTRAYLLALAGATAFAGCHDAANSSPDGGIDSGLVVNDAGDAAADASDVDSGGEDSMLLVSGDWSLNPSQEKYVCVRVTEPNELYIHEFVPVIPLGTHHTVLTMAPADGTPDGIVECDGFSVGPHMLFGSGVGTQPLTLPDGIAVHVEAGDQVLLNLHLHNADTTAPLSGTSAVRVRTLDASLVTDVAEVILAGKDEGLVVPARQTSTSTGTCSFSHAATIFSVFPHMHQLGTHMRVVAHPAGAAEAVVMDDEYSFDDQTYRDIAPQVVMPAGSTLTVDCTYDNPTSSAVHYGESSNDEMCYAGVYRYPAVTAIAFPTCTN